MNSLITDNIDLWTGAIQRRSGVGRGKGGSKKTELYGVKKLRELILEMAVRGLLVPQGPTDEPASVLLKKIAAEKEKLVKEKKIKKQKALPPIEDEEKPFELPVGWEWSRLGDIWRDSFYGPRFAKEEYVLEGGYPTIRTTDMTVDGYIDY